MKHHIVPSILFRHATLRKVLNFKANISKIFTNIQFIGWLFENNNRKNKPKLYFFLEIQVMEIKV